MIVACERCGTRFRLDEARIPSKGARVRCSRCKHAFFLRPPGISEQDLLESAASEAAREPWSPPEPAQDLEPGAQPLASESAPAASEAIGEEAEVAASPLPRAPAAAREDESDWEFNEAVPESGTPPELGAPQAPGDALDALLSADEPPGRTALDELGDPGSWDFLSASEGTRVSAAAALESAASEADGAPEPLGEDEEGAGDVDEPASASEDVHELPRAPVAPPRREPRALPASGSVRAPRSLPAGRWAGWALTLSMTAWVAVRALNPLAPPGPQPVSLALPGLVGMDLEAVRGRTVENLVAGPLYVVSGRFRNHETRWRGVESGVRVRLLGVDGEPLPGLEAPAGRPLAPQRLREEEPGALRAEHERGAARFARFAVAPGHPVSFEAVFDRVPPAAWAIEVDAAPLPSPAGGARGATDVPGGGPPPSGAPRAAPSPRSPLPSSG